MKYQIIRILFLFFPFGSIFSQDMSSLELKIDTIYIPNNFEKVQLIIITDNHAVRYQYANREIIDSVHFSKNTFYEFPNISLNTSFDLDTFLNLHQAQPPSPISLMKYNGGKIDTSQIVSHFEDWYTQTFDTILKTQYLIVNLDEDKTEEILIGIISEEDTIPYVYYMVDWINGEYAINGMISVRDEMSCSDFKFQKLASGNSVILSESYASSSCGGHCYTQFQSYSHQRLYTSNSHNSDFYFWPQCYFEDDNTNSVYWLDEKIISIDTTSYQVEYLFKKLKIRKLKFIKKLKVTDRYRMQLTFCLNQEKQQFICKEMDADILDLDFVWPTSIDVILEKYPQLIQRL